VFDPIRKHLEHLNLLGNEISQVEGLFRGMRILKTLNLKENQIRVRLEIVRLAFVLWEMSMFAGGRFSSCNMVILGIKM